MTSQEKMTMLAYSYTRRSLYGRVFEHDKHPSLTWALVEAKTQVDIANISTPFQL